MQQQQPAFFEMYKGVFHVQDILFSLNTGQFLSDGLSVFLNTILVNGFKIEPKIKSPQFSYCALFYFSQQMCFPAVLFCEFDLFRLNRFGTTVAFIWNQSEVILSINYTYYHLKVNAYSISDNMHSLTLNPAHLIS